MTPSRLLFYLVCFFAAYSQALRPEFGPVRVSLPYILSVAGLILLLAERAWSFPHTRRFDFRMYLPALLFVTVYLIIGSLAIVRIQANMVPNSTEAVFRVVEQLGRLVLSFCTMLLVANTVNSTETMVRSIKIIAVSAGLVGAYGIYQVVATVGGFYRPLLPNTGSYGLAPGMEGASRAIGTMQEPSFLAGFLCFSIASTVLLLVASGAVGRWLRAVLWVSLGVQAICLLMTTSTGGFAGFAVILAAGLFMLRGLHRRRFVRVWSIAAVLLTIPVMYVLAQPGFQNRLIVGTVGKMSHVSAMERSEFCRAGLEMFADHPGIGVGPGLYDNYARDYTRAFSASRVLIVNNVYIELLAETGIVGFLAFVVMFACVFRRAVRTWRHYGAHDLVYAAVVMALAALSVQFLAYPTFKMEFIWLLFGLAVAPYPSSGEDSSSRATDGAPDAGPV